MNLRQAITFAILVGPRILDCDPGYLVEKVLSCESYAVPEVLLDTAKLIEFRTYAVRWKMDWDTERDLKRPIAKVLEERI